METFKYEWTIPVLMYNKYLRTCIWKSPDFFGRKSNLSWYLQLEYNTLSSSETIMELRLFLNDCKKTDVYSKFKISIVYKESSIIYEITDAQLFQPNDSYEVMKCNYQEFLNNLNWEHNSNINEFNFFCEVTVLNIVKNSVKVLDCHLLEDLENIFEEQKFCDITFLVGGQEIQAHKNILSGRSRVFAAMFENEFAESKQNCVTITDIDHKVFKEILKFIYTGQAKKKESLAEEMLIGADKYDLEGLKVICEEVLIHQISFENVCDLLVLAERHNANQLKVQTMDYIKNNFANVKNTVGWIIIKDSDPSLVITVLEKCFTDVHL